MRYILSFHAALASVSIVAQVAAKPDFSIDSTSDIKNTAATIAHGLLSYYKGNQTGETPGILPGPPPLGDYYWGSAGAMWQFLIDYWYYTGDASYNNVIMQALMWQRGPMNNFMPLNVTPTIGNDDQGLWATAAMVAAERGFPDPPADTKLAWVPMVEDVFNNLVARFDTESCGGGLRWQIPFTNKGYDYKDTLSNGLFFSLSARLARYTGNKTYAEWADKAWDWVEGIGLIDNQTLAVYNGALTESNCKRVMKAEFTASNAIYVLGASYMYNQTNGDSKWKTRVNKLIEHGLKSFFPDNIAYEAACEKKKTCTPDITFFKGLMHQWWTASTQVAPFMSETVLPVLKKSAAAAVKQCTGEGEGEGVADGRLCGSSWARGSFDGETGAGQQMSALAAVSGLLVGDKAGPYTAKSGKSSGGSEGGGNGGTGGDGKANNGTSSGGKTGKDSAAGKLDYGVAGIMVMSVGTFLLTCMV